MKVTKARLVKLGACDKAIVRYFSDRKSCEAKDLLSAAIKNEDWLMAQWGLSRLMNHKQQITWAVYCAEQVIKIYEDKYSGDDRPRKAILAAKAYLKKPTPENKAAAYAAAYAANAAYAAAYDANAAANAAYAAAYAANAANAAYAAAYAANAAANAAYADEYKKMQIKLLRKGLEILEAK
jgi:hypothetical protein